MVEGDGADAAARAAAEFRDSRVVCFWDPDRRTGVAWAEHYQQQFAGALTTGLAPDDPLRARIEALRESGEEIAMWDVAYFFGPRVRWRGELPVPDSWTKQFGFEFDEAAGIAQGTFWHSAAPGGLVPSNWRSEFGAGMRTASVSSMGDAPDTQRVP